MLHDNFDSLDRGPAGGWTLGISVMVYRDGAHAVERIPSIGSRSSTYRCEISCGSCTWKRRVRTRAKHSHLRQDMMMIPLHRRVSPEPSLRPASITRLSGESRQQADRERGQRFPPTYVHTTDSLDENLAYSDTPAHLTQTGFHSLDRLRFIL